MKHSLTLLLGVTLLAGTAASAQQSRVSPHETTPAVLGGKKITIEYGRPYKKGRVIFGGLEKFGQVWRTGADEATTIETQGDLMLGSLHVPAGKYALFTIPDKTEWTLIINKVAKQSGAYEYDAKQDLGRVKMKIEKSPKVIEQLTISIEGQGSRGTLKIAWDDTIASIPVMMH
ncbi:MAG: hypothetical protein C0504_19310 [Candidatus Solibacter sp.]|nr:hypothetical protein [Candidatus Solibacter sp.]